MRLLQYDEEGNISLAIFYGNNIPPYAILSHTWGDEEVLFPDILGGNKTLLRSKAGNRKLEFCGRQAAKDGLLFFWVDTCCIDKSSSAELSEAINSMFYWYREATRCYVYLSDVPGEISDVLSAATFQNSRWFTRSWTLQELLAPKSVEFFTADGGYIGDKVTMLPEIHDITKIPPSALRGNLLEFSLAQRMSWAIGRTATRREDRAYSLIGLLEVFMPVIYGEGDNAWQRLQAEVARCSVSDLSTERAHRISPTNSYYFPLVENQFRLLLLEPGNLGSDITGQISEWNLLSPPSYYALSYVWGEEPAIHRILINGAVTLIRPNLFHALQRIRDLQTAPFLIWVDSLSINQQNDAERNVQVRRMSQIYNNAGGVFIWLGEEDATSKLAMELVTKIHDESQHSSPDNISSSWEGSWWKDYGFTALSLLLERPWFRRGWVLQEAAFSTNSIMQCGDRQLHMNHFAEVTNLIRFMISTEPRVTGLLHNRMRVGTLLNFLDSPAVRLLDLIEGAFVRTAEGRSLDRTMDLETLVYLSTFSETSNERDTIYALLNLANDQSSLLMHRQENIINPDYGKSIISVYTDFVSYCHNQNSCLDIICRPWAPNPYSHAQASSKDEQESLQLPSWICSRDKLPYGEPSWRLKHRLHGNPLVGRSSKRNYNAHLGTLPMVIKGPTGNRPHIFVVKGIIVAEILQTSSRMASAIVTQECLLLLGNPENSSGPDYKDKIGAWWRTLCADRDENGDPAPSSWQSAMEDLLELLNGDTISSIDIEELLDTDIPEHVRRYLRVVRDVVWNRRTFRSDMTADGKHLVGLIPPNARNGDQICILYGCSVPVVLRKHELSDQTLYWQLVGDAYVHGIMDGEFLGLLPEYMLGEKERSFELR